jgi:hypothetical protein
VWADQCLPELIRATSPEAVVFCGRWAAAKHEARWMLATCRCGTDVAWRAYRRAPDPGHPHVRALPRAPLEARAELASELSGGFRAASAAEAAR